MENHIRSVLVSKVICSYRTCIIYGNGSAVGIIQHSHGIGCRSLSECGSTVSRICPMPVRKSKYKIVRAVIRKRCCKRNGYPALRKGNRAFINNSQRVRRHEIAFRHSRSVSTSKINLGIVDCFWSRIAIIETYRIYLTLYNLFR